MNNLSRKFIWRQRIGFGIADYACNLAYFMTNTYLLFFYTNVVGIAAADAAFMFLITRVFDGVMDYVVGSIIDRTNTKLGRNRPWMLIGTPLLVISMVLVFMTPNWSQSGKLVYAYVTYIMFNLGYSITNIPLGSILPTLSSDPRERTVITTFRTVFSSLGSLTCASMALYLISQLGNGNTAIGYRNTNIVFAILVAVIMLSSVASIREINPAPKVKEKANIIRDMKELVKNKPYMLLLFYTLFMFLGMLGMSAAIAYYFTYIMGNEALTTGAVTIMTIAPIPAMILSAIINKKICKRDISILGNILQVIGFILILISGVNVAGAYAGVGIVSFGSGFKSTMFFSMGADVVDYGEWKFGRSMAGTQTAVRSFMNAIASAGASAIVAGLLAWGNYDGSAAVQPASANTAIIIAFIGLPIVSALISIGLMLAYDLDKNYENIKLELAKRKGLITESEINECPNDSKIMVNGTTTNIVE